ncbi:MAG: hypothetical protein J6R94_02415, partial [Agathobacter sp.]|nr:hypothetical protein [Agathobacter sp.]
MSMNKVFQIGDFKFRLITPEEINPPSNFMLFESCEDTAPYTYTVELGEEFPDFPGEKSVCREDLIVYKDGELE